MRERWIIITRVSPSCAEELAIDVDALSTLHAISRSVDDNSLKLYAEACAAVFRIWI